MLKAIGQPFIKLTGDVGEERREGEMEGWGVREAETVGEEKEAHSVKWALKLVKQKHLH